MTAPSNPPPPPPLSQAVNVTPILLSKAEADGIAYNTDPAKGPVFKPAKND